MITAIFDTIGQGITGFSTCLATSVTSITSMFWDTTNSVPTFLGTLSLIGLSAGLVFFAFKVIRRLLKRVG